MDVKSDQAKPAGEAFAEPSPAEVTLPAGQDRPEINAPLPEDSAANPLMPDLSWPQYGFYHTADSALASLARADVAHGRVTIKKAGRGWQPGRVVRQQPLTGAAISPDAVVELAVEGDGLFYHLPTGMREGSKEGELGVAELASLFDDSIEKAACYVHQGGLYFDISPDNKAGCARWMRLFGIDPEDWPERGWYKLAILLPHLQRLAGREDGLKLVLKVLLDLELESIVWRPHQTLLADDELSRFGERASRLGIDLIVGDSVEDEAMMEITIGPVSLPAYQEHQEEVELSIHRTLRLVLPYNVVYSVRWLVGDTGLAPRLGSQLENAVLGVNSHLGRK
jgi:Type VI secretion, TssG